jgi:NADH dehydrogenase FAD-containing subunit
VIVGAGPVGIELAGEIAAAFQDKQITLVAATQALLPDLGTKLGYALARQLQDMGVRLLMGRRAIELASTEAPFGPAHVKLDDGTQVAADLVFPVIGAKPVATFPTGTAITLHRGRIRVNSDLSVLNLPGVWALGDAAATADPMSVVSLERQVPYLVKQLRARATGAAPPSKPYQGWLNPPAVVPLGPRKGASRLPGKLVVGSWMTSLIKGRHLLVNKASKSLGVINDTKGRITNVV